MRKSGANRWNRLVAALLALLMLSAAVPASAQAATEGWQDIAITVMWQDAGGNVLMYPAVPIPEETGVFHGWWATLPEEALGGTVEILVQHPDSGYTYQLLGTEELSLIWYPTMNAYGLEDDYAQNLTYRYYGVESMFTDNLIKLYLSTMENPFAVAGEESFGGAGYLPGNEGFGGVDDLPGGEEGFGSAPGAELITPPPTQPDPITPVPVYTPATGQITVYYRHVDGRLLDTRTATLTEGQNTLWPESQQVGGLELVGDHSATVWLSADGRVDQDSVTFLYDTPYTLPVEAYIDVYYEHESYGVFDQDRVTLTEGVHPITPNSDLAQGYELISSDTVYVTVDANGWANPSSVTFRYATPYIPPVEAPIEVLYVHETYGVFDTERVTLTEGTYPITPNAALAQGYELISSDVAYVTVDSKGWTDTPSVTFLYRDAYVAPLEAQITIRYVDGMDRDIADPQVVMKGEGTHTISIDWTRVPVGYTLFSDVQSVQVTVRSGVASQSEVKFYFAEAAPTPSVFDVTIHYYDELGNEIVRRETRQLESGQHWITPNPQNLPEGYELVSEASFLLTVYEDGSMDRDAADVGFRYRAIPKEPVKAAVTIRYVNEFGHTVAGPYTRELTGTGSHTIYPDASVVPEAYDASGLEPAYVTVSDRGSVSPNTVSFLVQLRRETQTIPVGQSIRRYGLVNHNNVRFRTEPYAASNSTIITELDMDAPVYMLASEYNTKGEEWTKVIVDGRTGYIQTKYLDMLTQAASDTLARETGATPVPTFTPAPTPTESIVEIITPAPVTPAPYTGYAIVTLSTPLYSNHDYNSTLMDWLQPQEPVTIIGQVSGSTGILWSSVLTLDGQYGYVPSSNLQQVSQADAEWYISQWQQQNATPTPTVYVTSAPEQQGYALVIRSNAAFRSQPSEQSRVIDYLAYGTVAYITGQTYADGYTWHRVAYDGSSGYIRSDHIRLMSVREEEEYLKQQSAPTPTPTPTPRPSSGSALPAYGYVTTNNVNFRQGASKSSGSIMMLQKYAMATVMDTQMVDGVTWYHVSYNGQTGYIHGDFFKQMTVNEYSEFRTSGKYQQGVANNGNRTETEETTDPGGQYIPDAWYGSGGLQTSAPTATPSPTPTLGPLPDYVTGANPTYGAGNQGDSTHSGTSAGDGYLPTASPATAAPAAPSQNKQDKGSDTLIWIAVILLLASVGTGIGLLVHHQRKRREIAMKAAQRRAQQARNANRPYARQANQQRMGAYPSYGQNQGPLFPQQQPRPYEPQPYEPQPYEPKSFRSEPLPTEPERPYARQAEGTNEVANRRVGRRTAYQQSAEEKQDNE